MSNTINMNKYISRIFLNDKLTRIFQETTIFFLIKYAYIGRFYQPNLFAWHPIYNYYTFKRLSEHMNINSYLKNSETTTE